MVAEPVMVSRLSRCKILSFFRDGIVLQVIDQFLDVTADMEDGESLQYFQQRSMMMVNIVRRYCFSFKVCSRFKTALLASG